MNGNKIYIVTREGAYRHEILGIFDKRHLAELAADEISQSEGDDYHYITVTVVRLPEGQSIDMRAEDIIEAVEGSLRSALDERN